MQPPQTRTMQKTLVPRSVRAIKALRSQFSRHGTPKVFTSDNGNQFVCMSSASLCSSPKQLQGNGLVERAIVTVKLIDDGSDVHAELNTRNAVRERYNALSALLTFDR